MDELIQEFLTEATEHLETVDRQMVAFEADPSNADILRNIFRLVHTIKGTCGFLGLPRLERIAHAAETLLGQLRDGRPVTPDCVTLTLASIDRIRFLLRELERGGVEPEGDDHNLVARLDEYTAKPPATASATGQDAPFQSLERPLKAGEASLYDLERAFRETPGPDGTEVLNAGERTVPNATGGILLLSDQLAALAGASRGDRVEETAESRLAAQTIRVHVGALEQLMTMVSELVLTRNQLLEIARRENDQSFKLPLQRLLSITAELQDGVMKTRMQPIGNAWNKFPRVIRDLSAELGKKIELVMEGGETELDRQVLDQIKDPLMHMVRNSADHGIEPPAARLAAGKPETGRVTLQAAHEGGSITIRIADDGKGLDIARIRHKAMEAGLSNPADLDKMTDAQIARLIFHPGLTTAATLTSVSGRGVGMDVVKSNIDAIGGTIDITSEPGQGTAFLVKLPLTLTIVSALIVVVDHQRYAIPQAVIRELVRVREGTGHVIEHINGANLLRLRDRLLPIIPLSGLLQTGQTPAGNGFVVVVQFGHQQFGLLVDAVLQTEDIVVKPMSSILRGINLFAGNTILGDGAVVLILDPNGLARTVGHIDFGDVATVDQEPASVGDARDRQTMLVFRGGGGTLKAISLSLVTRLEELDGSSIEFNGGRPLVQYRGKLMPIVLLDAGLALNLTGIQPLLIFADGPRTMGLAVEGIVDIIEEHVDIAFADGRPGVLGSAILNGRATEIIDLAHYLPQAYPDWLTRPPAPVRSGVRHVLLVEQSPFIREMLAPVIKAAGFTPVYCGDATGAMAELSSSRTFDYVIVDIEDPASGGFALIECLLADRPGDAMGLIGLASVPHQVLVERCHAAGLRDLVAKFDRHGLMAAMNAGSLQIAEAA